MRLFHINGDAGIGPEGTKGASIHRRELIRAMSNAGHDVTPFSKRSGAGSIPFRDEFDLVGHARVHGAPDAIYERYSIGHVAGLRSATALGVPFVLEVNAPLLWEAQRHRGFRPTVAAMSAELELFRSATVIRVVSTWLHEYVSQQRRHPRRVHVIPNGHDPGMFERGASFDGPPTVVFLGHPKPWHGAERLVPLMIDLKLAQLDARMVLIGAGPGAEDIVERAGAAGLAERIRVTGSLDRAGVARELESGWVGIAPYGPTDDFYFSPLKVFDYLGAGLPVVASDLGDISSIVGGGGRVVPAWSRPALANAVRKLLTDRDLSARKGQLGRHRARTQQTWTHVVDAIESALDMAILGSMP